MHSHSLIISLSALACVAGASLLDPVVENVVHLQTALPPPDTPGIWRKKMIWKARWVKEWKQAKHWRPVWKKVWSPIEIREWLPIPRPPPADVTATISTSSGGPPGPVVFPSKPLHHDGPPGTPNGGPVPAYPPGPPEHVGPSGPPPNGHHGGHYPPSPNPNRLSEPFPEFRPLPSTQLHQVPDEWPQTDNLELLSTYQTIKNSDKDEFPKPERPPQPQNDQFSRPPQSSNQFYNAPRNPSTLAQFLEPPRSSIHPSRLVNEFHYSEPLKNSTEPNSKLNSLSPYAAKLAQAVLREKFNQSLNLTERPSGLTDVIYNPSSTTAKSVLSRVTKAAAGQSTTESSSNVYIVTPVALG